MADWKYIDPGAGDLIKPAPSAPAKIFRVNFDATQEMPVTLPRLEHIYPWSANPNFPIPFTTAEKPLTLEQLEAKLQAELTGVYSGVPASSPITVAEFQQLREKLLQLARFAQLDEQGQARLAENADEDLYKLEQMRQLASDLYNQRSNSRSDATKGSDKYLRHIGEAIHNLDGAIAERQTEKEILDGLRKGD